MRRLALLMAGAAVWLFLFAIPAFADGGPHVASVNNGTGGLTSDSCAGCHRAHTAQAEYLLKEEVPDLCLTCHGTSGLGATTNVEDGLQFAPAGDGSRSGTTLGALRAGGFVNAYIASGSPARLASNNTVPTLLGKVPVRSTAQAVTSTHMSITSLASATVWGNGPDNSGAGGTTTLNCTSCHNPHGNGQYRILNPRPAGEGGTMTAAATDAPVTDGPALTPVAGVLPTRNYTVQQWNGSARMLLASDVTAGAFGWQAGDYFHRKVPWNSTTSTAVDGPNGQPATFNGQINAWCAQCHTRYITTNRTYGPGQSSWNTNSGDAIFTFQHSNSSNKPCTTCHVAHGSNAQMTGFNSTHQYFPGEGTDPSATANADSRLLKVDNRGTCQMCHDPTNTTVPPGTVGSPPGAQVGPTPVPLIP